MKHLFLIAMAMALISCGGSASKQSTEDESISIIIESPLSDDKYDQEPIATYEVTEDEQVVSDFEIQKSLNDQDLGEFQSGDTLPAVEGYNEFTIEFKNVSVVIPFDLDTVNICQGHAHRKGKGHLRHDCDN